MKSFNDFLDTLDEKEVAKLTTQSAYKAISECGEVNINNISAIIIRATTTNSIQLLKCYHEWLSQQIDE